MNFQCKQDLWEYLSKTDKTVVMYGMGNGADKILAVCERYGISVSDFFASDGFVRGHSFHGKRVLSYSEVKERYGADHIIVLLSFGSSRPEVLELIYRVSEECETYAPDVPVCGDALFTRQFFEAHSEELLQAEALLADEESRRIFSNVIEYKLTGRIDLLRNAESDRREVFKLLSLNEVTSAADLGAYNGDTLRELAKEAPLLSYALAMEPDRRNFRKLSGYAENEARFVIDAENAAAWKEDTTLLFADSGNRNSGAFAKGKQIEVTARTLDSLLGGKPTDYVKYDVEGAEYEALLGSAETIRMHSPRLLVSAYHRSEDLFALPLLLRQLNPSYRIFLRRYPYVPAWDLNLICI